MSATETRPAIDDRPRFEGAWAADELDNLVENARPIGYGVVQVGQFVEGGIRVLAIKDLGSNYTSGVHRCDPRHEQRFVNKRVRPGDVLISVKGTIGRVGVVPEGYEGNISRELARLSFDGLHSPTFWRFQLLSIESQRLIEHVTVGTTRLELPIGVLKRLKLPYPPLPEQRAIAAALSDVDDLLQSLDRLIAKKRDVKQGAMQQLLTGTTRLPGFEGAWERTTVRDLMVRYFCGPSPTCEERNISTSQEWGVMKTTCATFDNGWDETKHKVLPKSYWPMTQIELQAGDVIVTKAGPRHRVGVPVHVDHARPHLVPSGKMIAVRPDESRVVPLMLALALRATEPQTYLDHRTTGMAESQVNFENEALIDAPVTLPPLPEQHAIATVLSDMDAEIDALGARRDKAAAIKQGMMQELLTGRTRLPIPQEVES